MNSMRMNYGWKLFIERTDVCEYHHYMVKCIPLIFGKQNFIECSNYEQIYESNLVDTFLIGLMKIIVARATNCGT